MDIKDPNIIAILQMLNSRLEGLRKRHDEIDPLEDLPDDGLFDATRASVSSTRGVTNQSWFSEELLEGKVFSFTDDDYESDSDLSDDGTLHTATVPAESSSDIDKASTDSATLDKPSPKENAKISKVVNWLKVLKPNKRVSNRSKSQDGNIEPFGISLDKEDADLREPTISSSLQDPEANSAAIPPAIPRKQSTPPLSEQDDATEHEPFPLVGNPAANDNNFFKFEVSCNFFSIAFASKMLF